MKQAIICFVFSSILLLVGCTVTQPLPTSLPVAALPTASVTTQPAHSTATPVPSATNLPDPAALTATPTQTITPSDTATTLPTSKSTAEPSRIPDIINPSLLPPTGRIYFLWDPNPINEERGIGELQKNNLYETIPNASPNNWQIETKIEMFGHPLMIPSPDSENLAIVRYDDTNGDGMVETQGDADRTNIYIFNTITNSITKLTETRWNPGLISWLPDAQSLTFAQLKDLYTVELDNPLHPNKLMSFSGAIYNHKWSPNGHYLLSLHAPSEQPSSSVIVELFNSQNNKSSIISEITAIPKDLLWSQDSQRIAFSEYGRSLQIVKVTDVVMKELVPFDNEVFFEWSPNEPWLAYTNNSKLLLWDAKTETNKQLIDIAVSNKPVWSPDGSQIAVSYGAGNQSGILIINLTDKSFEELDVGIEASQIIWSPDGEWLLLFSESDNGAGLYVVNTQEGIPFLLLDTRGRTSPYNIYWLP